MKKQVKPELFDILKALVDRRVPDLREQFRRGVEAQADISDLRAHICYLERHIDDNRYDREETQESKELIAENEERIEQKKSLVKAGDIAQEQLSASVDFYQTYDWVKNKSRLKQLEQEYSVLDARSDELDDLIFSCEVNIDPSSRSVEVCEQAERDMTKYQLEYKSVIQNMDRILKEINRLR